MQFFLSELTWIVLKRIRLSHKDENPGAFFKTSLRSFTVLDIFEEKIRTFTAPYTWKRCIIHFYKEIFYFPILGIGF